MRQTPHIEKHFTACRHAAGRQGLAAFGREFEAAVSGRARNEPFAAPILHVGRFLGFPYFLHSKWVDRRSRFQDCTLTIQRTSRKIQENGHFEACFFSLMCFNYSGQIGYLARE